MKAYVLKEGDAYVHAHNNSKRTKDFANAQIFDYIFEARYHLEKNMQRGYLGLERCRIVEIEYKEIEL